MSCLRLHSRASVPSAPRKYLVVTIVDAFTDQESGNSTPRCSKTVAPVFQLVWTTSRRSHESSSQGCTPSVLKTRSIFRPAPLCALRVVRAAPLTVSVMPVPHSHRVTTLSLVLLPWVTATCDVGLPGPRLPHHGPRSLWSARWGWLYGAGG